MLIYDRKFKKLSYHVQQLEANKRSDTISLIFTSHLIKKITSFLFKLRSIKHCEIKHMVQIRRKTI